MIINLLKILMDLILSILAFLIIICHLIYSFLYITNKYVVADNLISEENNLNNLHMNNNLLAMFFINLLNSLSIKLMEDKLIL